MDSDPGEYIGQGQAWHHGSAYGEPINVDVFAGGNIIQFAVQTRDGDSWTGSYGTTDGTPLHVGTYATNGAGSPASQGYGGHGRGCGRFTGQFTISTLAYDAKGALRTVHVSFEAHCEALDPALRGTFDFHAA